MKTIGVLGLGIIGGVWARHYHTAGVLAGAWNRTPRPDFPQWRSTPESVAGEADVVQIVVADPPAVGALIDCIRPSLGPAKTVIQSSTIDPKSSEAFRSAVVSTGARYLEAPFTGSKPAAEQRQTVFYLGGDPEVIEDVEPLLSLISTHRLLIGNHRQAATLKLAMNLNISAQMEALAETLTLIRRAGVPDDVFFDALAKNVSHSGLVNLKSAKLRAGDFAPQFSIKHMAKDLRLAAAMNGAAGFPVLQAVKERMAAAELAGFGEEDFAAIIKLL